MGLSVMAFTFFTRDVLPMRLGKIRMEYSILNVQLQTLRFQLAVSEMISICSVLGVRGG